MQTSCCLTLLAILAIVSVTHASAPIDSLDWSALNETVGGRLQRGIPLARPCFSTFNGQNVSIDPDACAAVQASYTNRTFRVSHFGDYMQANWGNCQSRVQNCLLDSSNPSNPVATSSPFTCDQGSVSPYYIQVEEASDAQAAFAFSSKTGVPLVIKNTGHDFLGRSSMKDGLALWMSALKSIDYSPSFIAEGCNKASATPAMTVGAGVLWKDAYAFAEANNVTILGAYSDTVGASGGWIMGGGHSILSPVFGLGVDRVLQYKIVTPDGQLRIANACQNTDLFWALRGGGGGTFGVLLETSQRVEPRLDLQVISLAYSPSPSVSSDFYSVVLNNSVTWAEQGWGGHIIGATLIYVNPILNASEAILSMKPITDWISEHNGTTVQETLPSWYAFFLKYLLPNASPGGTPALEATRFIPATIFTNLETRAEFQGIIDHLLESGGFPYVIADPPFNFEFDPNATSITPAWRTAVWEIAISTAVWNFNTSLSTVEALYANLTSNNKALRDLTPNSGVYFNEGDVHEPNHEMAYWGDNYPRLLSIKEKYDPEGLLQCWKCVGWTGPHDPRYSCYI